MGQFNIFLEGEGVGLLTFSAAPLGSAGVGRGRAHRFDVGFEVENDCLEVAGGGRQV